MKNPVKKTILLLAALALIAAGYSAWKIFGPGVLVSENTFIYIKSGENYGGVKKMLSEKKIISNPGWFDLAAKYLKYKEGVKAGKYQVKKGMSVFQLIRMLRNGRQTPVNLVITKLRTLDNFIAKVSGPFEFDSMDMVAFIKNNDTLHSYGLDTQTVMAAILPDTYTYFWNSTPKKVFDKLFAEYEKFWNDERKEKANKLGLTSVQVYTLASIIDEETNYTPEKSTIASVYLNRIKTGMPLQADPTVKFAMKDFGLKRIYERHLFFDSPYNTYKNKGLPPGPICTAIPSTLDAVLNAPETDYLYFVAKSDFSGAHVFAATYADHQKNAKAYQQALNRQDSIRNANQQ